MGAKSSHNIASFQNSEFCENYTVMDIESSNHSVMPPLESIHDDDNEDDQMPPLEPIHDDDNEDDQMPPLEPIQDDDQMSRIEPIQDDDQMSRIESIYNRYLHFSNQNRLEAPCQNIESISSPVVFTNDTIVNTVIESFISRSNLGFKKYNKTLDREDLSTVDWVNHAQEELMDAILYLERLKKNL